MGVVQRFLPVAAEAEQYMRKHGRQCLAENGINRLTMDAACRVTAQCPVVTRMITHRDASRQTLQQCHSFPEWFQRAERFRKLFVDDRCLVELLGMRSSTVLFELNAFGNDSFRSKSVALHDEDDAFGDRIRLAVSFSTALRDQRAEQRCAHAETEAAKRLAT